MSTDPFEVRLAAVLRDDAQRAVVRVDVVDLATRAMATGPRPKARRWFLLPVVALLLLGAGIVAGRLIPTNDPPRFPEGFQPTGAMSTARVDAAAATLADGRVLVVGGWQRLRTDADGAAPALASAEIFDPASGTFQMVGSMATPRRAATATRLPDDRVLVAGGFPTAANADGSEHLGDALRSVEIFDPQTGTFSVAGEMVDSRAVHAAVALQDGRVLLLGGLGLREEEPSALPGMGPLDTAEIFDPVSGTSRRLDARLILGGSDETATTLQDGRILLAPANGGVGAVELFDPTSETFTALEPVDDTRVAAKTLSTLPDGQVLMAGELVDRDGLRALKPAWRLFDPETGSFGPVMSTDAYSDRAVTLADGQVLLLGSPPSGDGLPVDPRAMIYDPATSTMRDVGPGTVPRERGQVVVRTGDGRVLIAGGLLGPSFDSGAGPAPSSGWVVYDSAELYGP